MYFMGEELYTIDLNNIGYMNNTFYTKPELSYDAFQDSFMTQFWLMELTRIKKNEFAFFGHFVNYDLPKTLNVIKRATVEFGADEGDVRSILENTELRDKFIEYLNKMFEHTLVYYAVINCFSTALKQSGGKMVINEEVKRLSRKMTIQEYYEIFKDICNNPEITTKRGIKTFYSDYVEGGCI